MVNIINKGDLCPIFGVIVILLSLGLALADDGQKKLGTIMAIVVFLSYGVYSITTFPPRDAAALFHTALRTLHVFGLALGLFWVVLALLWKIGTPIVTQLRVSAHLSREAAMRRSRERAELMRARQEAQRRLREAPGMERTQREAALAAEAKKNELKKCEDARAAEEMFYQLHSQKLSDRFPKKDFEEFVAKYMKGGSFSEVAARGKQLRDLMEGHLRQAEPAKNPLHESERADAKKELRRFYEHNETILSEPYPREMLEAYIRKEMGEEKTPAECWTACHALIAELLPLISSKKQEQMKTNAQRTKREMDIDRIEGEIASRNEAIDRLMKVSGDRDLAEGKIVQERGRIRELDRKLKALKREEHHV